MNGALRAGGKRLGGALVALGLVAAPYIDLEVSADIWAWHANVPVADLVALLSMLLALGHRCARAATGVEALLGPGPSGAAWPGTLELAGWCGLCGVGLLAAGNGAALPGVGPDGWHTLLRKGVFPLLAWRFGFAVLVHATAIRGRPGFAVRWLTTSAFICALVLTASSVARILAGKTLWWAAVEGLTNNHKTLAVFLAPTIPLVATVSPPAAGAILIAIAASWSKAAWVTAAFAVGWVTLPGRMRARALGLGVLVGLAGMAWLPYLAQSPEQIDSLRSRISLNKRAWEMFLHHPWVGWGAGSNVRYEISTYPDYRVNGVDAHGVFAKIGSEYGVLGALGWLTATAALAWRFTRGASSPRRSRLDDALLGTFLALHLNLLTSTETFSQTHWAVLGLICGLSARRR